MLTTFGLGVGRQHNKNLATFEAEFARARAELSTPEVLDQVQTCADWLALQRPTKTLNRERTSYQLKHDVERWVSRTRKKHQYISNGGFVAAALGLGFSFKPAGWSVYLNLSKRQLRLVAEGDS